MFCKGVCGNQTTWSPVGCVHHCGLVQKSSSCASSNLPKLKPFKGSSLYQARSPRKHSIVANVWSGGWSARRPPPQQAQFGSCRRDQPGVPECWPPLRLRLRVGGRRRLSTLIEGYLYRMRLAELLKWGQLRLALCLAVCQQGFRPQGEGSSFT